MKKFALSSIALAALLLSGCESGNRSKAERLLENYAVVEIPVPDLSDITDNGKEVLNLYRFAADEADNIYWKQYFGDKSLMEGLSDDALRQYAMVNYGPWDRIDDKPFVEGYGPKPAGLNFYPADMTDEEFASFTDPAKDSPYTLVRRSENGALKTVWYHDAYADNIDKIASYLTAAADITIKPSVRNYLLRKIDGLRTDDYYDSDKAWLEMTDSKMDLVIGPNESMDDGLYGKKASYGAYVLLKNLSRTEQLSQLCARLPEFQQMLPVAPEYRDFVPGSESNIFSCNVIYYGGYTNAGFKVIAINFPYDSRVQEEFGTRTILFDNIIKDKFNRTVFPVGMHLFETDQQAHLDANAFYWTIVFREVAKG
ncbi:MAG: Zn-dependent hydrolase, partial [Bacteroidaceae bacterium]|nr:Zn-dependent hydrolase [Bacteroidaceae bacterium]